MKVSKSILLACSIYQFELAKALKLQFGTGGGLVLPSDNVDGWLQFNLNLLLGYQF